MNLVRLITTRSYRCWSQTLRCRPLTRPSYYPFVRQLSASQTFRNTGEQDDANAKSALRVLEQGESGKFSDRSGSEDDTDALRARIAELEKELAQYAQQHGGRNRDPNELFGDIFDEMPEELRPLRITRDNLKELIRKGDPQAMQYDGAEELAKDMEAGVEEEEYDLDKVLRRLPEDLRSRLTRQELRKMLEEDDPSIQQYLLEQVICDLDGTYDNLPTDMKEALTKDQVRTMIESQDPAIQEYLCEVEEDQDVDELENKPLEENTGVRSKDHVRGMMNEDPTMKEYLHRAEQQDDDDGFGQDTFARAAKETFEQDQEEDELGVGIPEHVKIHLNSFNKLLRGVISEKEDSKSIGLLWNKYEYCKRSMPGFLEELPAHIWDILWKSQWDGNPIPESRKNHLWTLVNDMLDVEHPLQPDQILVQIEYEFSEGSKNEAMKMWQQEYNALPKDDPKRDDYRDLGVRLYVEAGSFDEAQRLVFGKARRNDVRASDVAVLVAAKASKNDEINLKTAWSLYVGMRERLGHQISLEDFDQIAMAFLGAKRPNLALAVFKDMVLSARLRPKEIETQSRSLAILREIQEQAKTKEDLELVSLESLISIPRQLENKYFYASWIKRLIGLGQVDTTVQVLELMFQRGVRPDARHINGIIGAWLRSPDKDKHQLAIQIGWSMVNQRLKFVARRRNAAVGEVSAVDNLDPGKLVPPYISQNLPLANIETFCLLLLYYQRRSMSQSVDNVTRFLQEAEIAPNSFFINHLLFAELRKQNIGRAWKIYDKASQNITPDLETYFALWKCEKIFTAGRTSNAPEFPRSRRLFFIMSRWFHKLHGRQRKETLESFDADMYNEIIRCFCFQKDVEGTIVALYGLRDMFNAYPNAETERIILIQLARLGEGPVARSRRSRSNHRFSANANSTKDFARISKVAEFVKQERIQALKDNGIEDSALKGTQRQEEDLYRIVQVLRVCLRHQAGMEMDQICLQEEQIGSVIEEMSVSPINTSPPELKATG